MKNIEKKAQTSRGRDIFIERFFVGGARNHIRKTTGDAPWLSVGIMEPMNPIALYSSRLFAALNIVGGGAYSLGHGLNHGYLEDAAPQHIERAVKNLNALPAEEIVFYHDESLCGLDRAREMGLALRFRPVSLLEWLIREVEESGREIVQLNAEAAVQLPCSVSGGRDRNELIEKLFGLIGVRRAARKFDYGGRLCCGARGYWGLSSGNPQADADDSDTIVNENVADARMSGAQYLVTLCPMCYAAVAPAGRAAGLIPISIEGLVSLALYGEALPEGLIFS